MKLENKGKETSLYIKKKELGKVLKLRLENLYFGDTYEFETAEEMVEGIRQLGLLQELTQEDIKNILNKRHQQWGVEWFIEN